MDLSLATLAVTAGRPPVRPDEPLNPPVVLSSTYHAGGEVGYGRYGNPTWSAFEDAVGALEGGRALAFASGIAALSAVLGTLAHGSTVVAPSHPYTGTAALLADHEVAGRLVVRRVDITDAAAVAEPRAPERRCCGSSHRPTRSSASPTSRPPARPRTRSAPSSPSTTRSTPRSDCDRSASARTSSCTA